MDTGSLFQDILAVLGHSLGLDQEGVLWHDKGDALRVIGPGADSPWVKPWLDQLPALLARTSAVSLWGSQDFDLAAAAPRVLFFPLLVQNAESYGVLWPVPEDFDLSAAQRRELEPLARLVTQALQGAQVWQESQRRLVRLEAVASVGRDATILIDSNDLLERVTHLISAQFGFYHVGIFLIDEKREYAVLRASNSEGGRRLLELGHKLKIGAQGMVGYVAATGEPRIALDVGADKVHFVNVFLPHTRSEISLPMRHRGEVLGVLDVQSTEAGAFSPDDFTALQIMADQLANALVNARLYEALQHRLEETHLLREVMLEASALRQDEVLSQAAKLLREALPFPFQAFLKPASGGLLVPVTPDGNWPFPAQSLSATPWADVWAGMPLWLGGEAVSAWLGRQARELYAVPVRVAGETALLFVLATSQPFSLDRPQFMRFLESLATELGVLLENARLYEKSLQAAERLERLVRSGRLMAATRSTESLVELISETLLYELQAHIEVGMLDEAHQIQHVWEAGLPAGGASSEALLYELPIDLVLSEMQLETRLNVPYLQAQAESVGIECPVWGRLESGVYRFYPLRTAGRLLGVLLLGLSTDLTEEQEAWVQALVNQAALALENAGLLEQLMAQAQELQRAYEEAQHLNDVRTQMLQNVSHELRTPMGLILGYTEMLQDGTLGDLSEQQRHALEVIYQRASDLNRMIQGLTVFHGGLQPEHLETIALSPLLADIINEFTNAARKRNISLSLSVPVEVLTVKGDRSRLRLAISHLVENAIKFSEAGDEVRVSAQSAAGQAVIVVKDEGVGIAPEQLTRIFERFYQVDGSMRRRVGGMGIGLALVWEIVEAHGGHVTVNSEPGVGSEFIVYLPLMESESIFASFDELRS